MPVEYQVGVFPPQDLDWERLVPHIGRAHDAVGRYDGLLSSIPNRDVLLSPLRTQEAVLSSAIEGTQTTLTEVLRFAAEGNIDDESTPARASWREVLNYDRAIDRSVALLDELPLSSRLL